MLARRKQGVGMVRIERQGVVQVRQRLVETCRRLPATGPCQEPLRVHPARMSTAKLASSRARSILPRAKVRPGPAMIASVQRGLRQTASLKSSRAFSCSPVMR